MIVRVEPLSSHHDLAPLRSGNDAEDAWVNSGAAGARDRGVRAYVALDGLDAVVGFFAVAPHIVEREESLSSPRPFAPSRARIPAVLIVKLLTDRTRSRPQLVDELLIEALRTVLPAAVTVGARLVLAEAPDSAMARTYEANGFTVLPGHSRRLVLKLATAAAAVGVH